MIRRRKEKIVKEEIKKKEANKEKISRKEANKEKTKENTQEKQLAKEVSEGRHLYAVSILKNTNAEKEAEEHTRIRYMKLEPQRPHLKLVLMADKTCARFYGKYPQEISVRGQKFRFKFMPKYVTSKDLEPV